MPNNYLFSIIIPTCNRPSTLQACLDGLSSDTQNFDNNRFEVIVSNDGTESVLDNLRLQYPHVRFVQGPKKGPAANRNRGAQYATGEWLLFTDDDCIPDPHWLRGYERAIIDNPKVSVLEGRVFADRPRKSVREVAPINETGGYLWSCNFAIRRALFQELEGFSEAFPYAAMEDVEIRTRIIEHDEEFPFIAGAAVCHPWRIHKGWKEFIAQGKSIMTYVNLHPKASDKVNSLFFLCSIRNSLRDHGVFAVASQDIDGLLHIVKETVYNLCMIASLTAHRIISCINIKDINAGNVHTGNMNTKNINAGDPQ